MTILAATMYVLSRAFKNEQIIKKKSSVVVLEGKAEKAEKAEEDSPLEVPLWIPWSYGWLGGYTRPVKRDMPHFYPGSRSNSYRDERGAPDAHNNGRIFQTL
jgi:hypothetical protein